MGLPRNLETHVITQMTNKWRTPLEFWNHPYRRQSMAYTGGGLSLWDENAVIFLDCSVFDDHLCERGCPHLGNHSTMLAQVPGMRRGQPLREVFKSFFRIPCS